MKENELKRIVGVAILVIGTLLAILYWVGTSLPIASSIPVQKFTGDNPVVLGNLALGQEFSFSLWVKPDEDNPDWAAIIDYRHSATKSFAFHQKGGEKNLFAFGVHAAKDVYGVYARLTPGRWQHVTLLKSLDEITIYLDGKKVDSKHFDRHFEVGYAGDEVLTVGGWGYGERRWRGSVSCMRVFNYRLSHPIIKILTRCSGCVTG